MHPLFPGSHPVKYQGQYSGQRPADGPCQPDAGLLPQGRKDKRKDHTQCQIQKGGYHKILHALPAPQYRVTADFHCNHTVEGGNDPQEQKSCIHCQYCAVLVHKQPQKRTAQEAEQKGKRH